MPSPRKGSSSSSVPPYLIQLFEALVEIADIPHASYGGREQPWIVADLIDQEQLYELQEKVSALLERVANSMSKAGDTSGVRTLQKRFPYLFK